MESRPLEVEEGLTLFQHVRAREHRNYLNNCNDDIEEIKYEDGLSTFRISASTPTRSGGLLVFDAEKNDYDWLLTPPGTPLFPSLDQETASINLPRRTSVTGSISTSRLSKEPPLKGPSGIPSSRRSSGVPVTRTTPACAYTTPIPQRAKAATPPRTPASSSKVRSPSPSPSSTRSHTSARAFSPGRSVTPTGQSPARASKSASKPSTSCQNFSPLLAGGPGHSARRNPRSSVSPKLALWESVTGVCSTESSPNLHTSPSKRLQRGTAKFSEKGASFRINGSPLESVKNFRRPKWRTISADNIESYSFLHDKRKQISKKSPAVKNENFMREKFNNHLSIASVSTRISPSEDRKNELFFRREASGSPYTKEPISDFANQKLMQQHSASGRSSFPPLMSSATAALHHETKPDRSNYDSSSSVLPCMMVNDNSKWQSHYLPEIDCSDIRIGQDQVSPRRWSVDSGLRFVNAGPRSMDFPYNPYEYNLTLAKTIRSTLDEETGLACVLMENDKLPIEQLKNDMFCRESESALPINPDSNAGRKQLKSESQDRNEKHCKHALQAKSFSSETQTQTDKSIWQNLSEHRREDHRILNGNKTWSSPRNMLKKDSVESAYGTLSPQVTKGRYNGSQHAARLSVRRQLYMANADVDCGTWSMKKTQSFDISTSDSYSCTESLDSSYIDNCTEKFSEDLSEVDSISHTGCSNSNSSATNHSIYNHVCLERPFSAADIYAEQDEVLNSLPLNSGTAGLEVSKPVTDSGAKKQGMKGRIESLSRDPSRFQERSVGYHHDQVMVSGNNRLRLENAHGFMEALEMKQRKSTAQLCYTNLDIKGEHPATTVLNLNGGKGGELTTLKSTVATEVEEESTGWDESCKRVQPKASPLKRNVTLEEATDTILFCSSIVHEIVYKAATLSEEKSRMKSQDPAKVCGLICKTESGGSSPCWSWNRRREPLHQQSIDQELLQETQQSTSCGSKGLIFQNTAEQKKEKRRGFCCFG